ncbi:hypothetical protein T484DRAFT_1756180 [Baffinella frigidus]|nr:hypothetical protein T484DRAFT_1756180 [Cryptophyta sp. CCMP2293]
MGDLTPHERIRDIANHIQDGNLDWICGIQSSKPNQNYIVCSDLSILDALRSISNPEQRILEGLMKIAIFRGWKITVVYIEAQFPWRNRGTLSEKKELECHFWYGIHFLCTHLDMDPVDRFHDESLFDRMTAISTKLLEYLPTRTELVELCLRNAWVKSAKYITDLFETTIKNRANETRLGSYRATDRLFYEGMTTCIRLSSKTMMHVDKDPAELWSDGVVQEIERRDGLGCQLLKLFQDVFYVPEDYEMVLVYADIMHCTKLKRMIMIHENINDSWWPDIRRNTRFVRTAAFHEEEQIVKLLVQKGYSINTNDREYSILHELIAGGHGDGFTDMIKFLCSLGADKHKRDMHGRLPIHILGHCGEDGIFDMMDSEPEEWRPALDLCLDDRGRSPLHHSASSSAEIEHFDIIWERLGFDLLTEDNRGYTPIHECARNGNTPQLETIATETFYLRNLEDAFGMTLLDSAAEGGRRHTTHFLLSCWKEPPRSISRVSQIATLLNTKITNGDNTGESLMFASCKVSPRDRVCDYLEYMVSRGASLDINDDHDNNLMHAVAMCNTWRDDRTEITEIYPGDKLYFWKEGRYSDDVEEPCVPGGGNCLPILQKLFSLKPGMLFHRNHKGETPMISALYHANTFTVASFLFLAKQELTDQAFADFVDTRNNTGMSALYLALYLHDNQDPTSNASRHQRYFYIAELLLGWGARMDVHITTILKTFKQKYGNSDSMNRVLAMSFVRTPHMYKGRSVGRVAAMPPEIFEKVTIDAVTAMTTKIRLVEGPSNFWENAQIFRRQWHHAHMIDRHRRPTIDLKILLTPQSF